MPTRPYVTRSSALALQALPQRASGASSSVSRLTHNSLTWLASGSSRPSDSRGSHERLSDIGTGLRICLLPVACPSVWRYMRLQGLDTELGQQPDLHAPVEKAKWLIGPRIRKPVGSRPTISRLKISRLPR